MYEIVRTLNSIVVNTHVTVAYNNTTQFDKRDAWMLAWVRKRATTLEWVSATEIDDQPEREKCVLLFRLSIIIGRTDCSLLTWSARVVFSCSFILGSRANCKELSPFNVEPKYEKYTIRARSSDRTDTKYFQYIKTKLCAWSRRNFTFA